jgi:hypothetical protein
MDITIDSHWTLFARLKKIFVRVVWVSDLFSFTPARRTDSYGACRAPA